MNRFYLRNVARISWIIALGMGLLFLDFISKAYVYEVLSLKEGCVGAYCSGIPVFYDFFGIDFQISLVINKGAAWGVLADFQIFLLILRIAVIFGIFIYLFFFNRNPHFDFPLIFVSAGAIGNVIDYFLYGYVIDFLHFSFWGYHFAIFNLADTFITIGVVWLFILGLFTRKKKYKVD
jgi:signal peptidase II